MYHKFLLGTAVGMWLMVNTHRYRIMAALEVETWFHITIGFT